MCGWFHVCESARFLKLAAFGLAVGAIVAGAGAGGPGPDVIVGELPDTSSYGTEGATGIFAYDIGTESCNAGSANVGWFANTNQHPVIAQNVYRIKNGRFEQIGVSWVKHGFAALTGNQCNFGCNGQGGSVLGVGCSDPYTFGLNGAQFGLGPRFEVNAATGAFPYPFTSPSFSGILPRRIQIAGADIDPALNPGAVYVGEGVYVAPDDALAGNGWNNASYRFMQFAGDADRTSTFAPGSTTRRTKAAIYAWQEIDPTVTVRPIDVPGDGQLLVAQKVSETSPGVWHYELAIENLSSDRAVRAVEVGAPAVGAGSISAIGFSGVQYHSGEPFDSTPWTGSRLSASVRWNTQTFAENANANAVRWGTAYAFRFDSSVAPGVGAARLELFKPGSGASAPYSSVTVPVLTPAGATLATTAAPGDDCASAVSVHAGVNGLSTLGATGAGPAACENGAPPSTAILADVWCRYTFADTCSGPLTISTCGSSFDSVIAVYAGASCPTAPGTQIACSDDAPTVCPADPSGASVTINITPGQTVLIRVGSRDGATGHVLLNIDVPRCAPPAGACCSQQGGCQITGGQGACQATGGVWQGGNSVCAPNPCPQPPRPPNDLCQNAIAVADVLTGAALVEGSNVNSTNDAGVPDCEGGSRDVWYSYVPANSNPITVSLCDSPAINFADTVLQVLTGTCGSLSQVACNDDFCSGRSQVQFTGVPGTRYLIRVMGFAGGTGAFTLRVSGGGGTLAGACCTGSTCSVSTAATCTGSIARFAGVGTSCNPPGNAVSPCCKADFNQSGTITVQDVFDFLAAWFVGSIAADFSGNGAGTPTVQSVFDFLAAWFAGGCGS